ncbi:hypothetical protein [Thermicanus aegyptius]|uniref:hypothetical protein n=1 Tax=Thermicanus aegyptius TaxID=94009 RepID=UPI00048DBCD1|nr:hypothetical protein [Thermicanus aegyptius]
MPLKYGNDGEREEITQNKESNAGRAEEKIKRTGKNERELPKKSSIQKKREPSTEEKKTKKERER